MKNKKRLYFLIGLLFVSVLVLAYLMGAAEDYQGSLNIKSEVKTQDVFSDEENIWGPGNLTEVDDYAATDPLTGGVDNDTATDPLTDGAGDYAATDDYRSIDLAPLDGIRVLPGDR